MSSYIFIRKNGVTLSCYSRSHPLYEALSPYAKWGEWSELTMDRLKHALNDTNDEIKSLKNSRAQQEEALPYLKDASEVYSTISCIHSIDEEIEEQQAANYYIRFLFDIAEETAYYEKGDDGKEDYSKPVKPVLEIMID